MDDYSGKRASDRLVSRKGPGLVLRETHNRDCNAQVCSRLGYSSRPISVKGAQNEKVKHSRPAFRSSLNGKEIVGSSSRSSISVNSSRKSIREPCKKLSTNLETDTSETSSIQEDPEVSEVSPPEKLQRPLRTESTNGECSETSLMEVGSCEVSSNTRLRRSFNPRPGLRNQETFPGSAVPLGSKTKSQATRPSTTRIGLRNLKCNSVSDIVPSSSCSSSDSSANRRETVKKRISEGESSSATKGKKMNSSSPSQGITIADSRRGRNAPPNRDIGVASVRTWRTSTVQTRSRVNQGTRNNVSGNGTSSVGPHMSQPDMSVNLNGASSSRHICSETPASRGNSFSRPGSSSRPGSGVGSLHGMIRSGPADISFTRSLMNQDGQRRYNMDGIAEVLLALERIEQDEELSFEQILVLETNLFLNGLNFYDQHRDMRLDIDNMSYEELLALEERMGFVSTALPEEALTDCIKKSIFQSEPLFLDDASIGCDNKDEVKCSICQEEYVAGDEVGKLRCEHSYHLACVNQWLRVKNWCPICKAEAAAATAASAPSSPSSPYST